MKTMDISLNSIDKVKTFVNLINRFDYDFDLVSGRYFSLDLSKPIALNIYAEGEIADDIVKQLTPYLV